jgi:hypothetical protein
MLANVELYQNKSYYFVIARYFNDIDTVCTDAWFIPVYERDQNAGDRDGPHMPNTS